MERERLAVERRHSSERPVNVMSCNNQFSLKLFLRSQMVTAFKKNDWKSASEKDLNPDDIGKPGSAQFFCEVSRCFKLFESLRDMHAARYQGFLHRNS